MAKVQEEWKMLRLPEFEQLKALLSGSHPTRKGFTDAEILHLCWLGAQIPEAGRIVELGSHRGKSACCIACGARLAVKEFRMSCVDLWTSGEGIANDHYKDRLYSSQETFDIFNKQIREMGVDRFITAIMCSTDEAVAYYRGSIDLLFIDANHDYEFVRRDYRNWAKCIPVGGRLAFHDYAGSQSAGTIKVVSEIVLPSREWEDVEIVDRIISMRRKTHGR